MLLGRECILDEVLDLIEITLELIVFALGLIKRSLRLGDQLLRFVNRGANALFNLREQPRQGRISRAPGLIKQVLDLGYNCVDRILHVLRNIGKRLLCRRIAGLGLGLRRLKGRLGLLCIRLRAVVVVRLEELLKCPLGDLDRLLAGLPGLLAVLLCRERIANELFNLIEITLELVVFGLGLVEDALRLRDQRLRLFDRLANALFDFSDRATQRGILTIAR